MVAAEGFWGTLGDFAGAMRLWINVVMAAKALGSTLEDAAARYFFTAQGRKLLDESRASSRRSRTGAVTRDPGRAGPNRGGSHREVRSPDDRDHHGG